MDHDESIYGKGPTRKVWHIANAIIFFIIGIFISPWSPDVVDTVGTFLLEVPKIVSIENFKKTSNFIATGRVEGEQVLSIQKDLEPRQTPESVLTEEIELQLEEDFSNANPPEIGTKEYYRQHPDDYPNEKRLSEITDEVYTIANELEFWNTTLLLDIIFFESEFRQFIVNDIGEYSRGIVQINRTSHPEVSDEQAFSIDFSARWAIDVINQGLERKEWYTTMLKIENWSL